MYFLGGRIASKKFLRDSFSGSGSACSNFGIGINLLSIPSAPT
jgi:hypothetical protein